MIDRTSPAQSEKTLHEEYPPDESTSRNDDVAVHDKSAKEKTRWQRIYDVLSYVPPRCRYDPEKPFKFSMGLNILFGSY